MFELFQFTYWSQILNNKILAWTFESTDFFFFNVCVLFIVCTFWQSLAIRANKVSRGTMRMVCLTSLASAAKWSWAVWGLFWRETRRPLSRAVDQMNCATFSPHKHTLAPSAESESGRRLTNPLKICQIASFPRRVRGFFLFFFFLIQRQSLLCFYILPEVLEIQCTLLVRAPPTCAWGVTELISAWEMILQEFWLTGTQFVVFISSRNQTKKLKVWDRLT